jgi:hypothetical protein
VTPTEVNSFATATDVTDAIEEMTRPNSTVFFNMVVSSVILVLPTFSAFSVSSPASIHVKVGDGTLKAFTALPVFSAKVGCGEMIKQISSASTLSRSPAVALMPA